jgi:4-amino-4-deoxy-L-arabinose transferase-like glycosyltransferase
MMFFLGTVGELPQLPRPEQPQGPTPIISERWAHAVGRVISSPLAVFSLAWIARLRVLAEFLPRHGWNNDFYRYNEPSHIAAALVSGLGYSAPWPTTIIVPTAQQPPLYPLLLAGIFRLAGTFSYPSLWIALGLNAVFSAVTAVLILRIGRRDFGDVTGILAAWVWSCWPYEAAISVRLWDSSLAALLLVMSVLMLPKFAETLSLRRWLLFGALVAVAALTNTTLLSVLPFFWLWLWIRYRRHGQSCAKVLLASLTICVLVLLPWTIRNYTVFHRPIPVRDNFALELWVGIELGSATPGAVITRPFPSDFPLGDPTDYDRMGEIGFMESRSRMAMQFIQQHPREYLRMAAIRCFRFWSEPGDGWLLISALAWLGAILTVMRKRMDALPYVAVLVIFPLVYYITNTFPTYRHPIEPVMLLLAAYAAVRVEQAIARWLFRIGSSSPSAA